MGIKRFIRNYFLHDRVTQASLDNIQRQLDHLAEISTTNTTQYWIDKLRDKTFNSQKPGVCADKHCEHEVIVSLTTFGNRINNVHLAIESIMQGSILPNRIILWLAKDEFHDLALPRSILLQQKRGLEICFCDDLKSYKKLIPTLSQHPNAIIITIDDDVMYDYDVLERLLNKHHTAPTAICSCRMHRITLDSAGMPKSYLEWDGEINDEKKSRLNFPTGVGSILYPPGCFSEEVFNIDAFQRLCPQADDIWFYAMALLNETPIIKVMTDNPAGPYHPLPISPDSLCHSNTNPNDCKNDIQLKNVFEYYNLYEKLKTIIPQ